VQPEIRSGLPVGISIAKKYPGHVIAGIAEGPTQEYFELYEELSAELDVAAAAAEAFIQSAGYRAIALTRETVSKTRDGYNTALPYKTLATRAGLGFIGKCALLVTKEYGSAVRLCGILTDAPLPVSEPINESECGTCHACAEACPGGAITGEQWSLGTARDSLVDAPKCAKAARERAARSIGNDSRVVCGKCIEVCPYTKKYIQAGA